jgi:glucose/arabinose dehydrogenase
MFRTWMLFVAAVAGVLLMVLACHRSAAEPGGPPTGRPYGLQKRLPWTTSRIVGSPDPLPPFRVERAFPNLKLNYPIAVAHQPGSDRLLLITATQSYGPVKIERIVDDPKTNKVETLLELDAVAYSIVFHPDFAKTGYLYVGSNGPERGKGPKKTQVHRYTMERQAPYKLDSGSAKLIIEWESNGHNGGAMAFGKDGMFYVTSGDGTSDSDTNIVGQNMSMLLAKVLRIDVDHPDPGKAYAVPKDNPFLAMQGARPETWAYGLRNPWRMTVDSKTGHLWVGKTGRTSGNRRISSRRERITAGA